MNNFEILNSEKHSAYQNVWMWHTLNVCMWIYLREQLAYITDILCLCCRNFSLRLLNLTVTSVTVFVFSWGVKRNTTWGVLWNTNKVATPALTGVYEIWIQRYAAAWPGSCCSRARTKRRCCSRTRTQWLGLLTFTTWTHIWALDNTVSTT